VRGEVKIRKKPHLSLPTGQAGSPKEREAGKNTAENSARSRKSCVSKSPFAFPLLWRGVRGEVKKSRPFGQDLYSTST